MTKAGTNTPSDRFLVSILLRRFYTRLLFPRSTVTELFGKPNVMDVTRFGVHTGYVYQSWLIPLTCGVRDIGREFGISKFPRR